ncbi:ricin-type beta-trefoil lectin domain protein [Dactylosporangium sp. NPDC051541]|uniref:poly(ethylene terephthalate) hydrolase family protein n=1 Tax=Dactylosporangium sp. NPDC051541 TaxID=3363977 RepID=UPI003798CB3D
MHRDFGSEEGESPHGHTALTDRASSPRRRRIAAAAAALTVAAATVATTLLTGASPAAAASYQRGPDPTVQSVTATRGTFATAEITVPTGNGFNGGKIYYPTDTSQGTWGAIAAVPGYTASWAAEGAWMGPWLASFGFVVIGIDTNSPTDYDTARGTQLLAALDYLTGQSTVRDRVDPNRLAVLGHSMGGGGAISAAMRRPSLKAAIPLAPASFSQNLSNVRVPTLIIGARDDGTITPSSIDTLWASKPATTKGARVELTSGGHGFPTWGNSQVTRREIPWLKIFLDNDNRYAQFLCPSLADSTGVSRYVSECPYGSPTSPSSQSPSSGPSTPPAGGAGPVHAVGADRCLDVPNASQANNTQLEIWDCNGGTNQRFTTTNAKQLTVYGNKCLDASGHGRTNGTPVIIWDCGSGTNQQWNINTNGTITGAESGLCLDVTGGSTTNGALVQLWTCNGGSQQQWRIG